MEYIDDLYQKDKLEIFISYDANKVLNKIGKKVKFNVYYRLRNIKLNFIQKLMFKLLIKHYVKHKIYLERKWYVDNEKITEIKINKIINLNKIPFEKCDMNMVKLKAFLDLIKDEVWYLRAKSYLGWIKHSLDVYLYKNKTMFISEDLFKVRGVLRAMSWRDMIIITDEGNYPVTTYYKDKNVKFDNQSDYKKLGTFVNVYMKDNFVIYKPKQDNPKTDKASSNELISDIVKEYIRRMVCKL